MKCCLLTISILLSPAGLAQAQPAVPPASLAATASQPAAEPNTPGNHVRGIEVKCQNATDGVKVTVEGGRTVFTVTSPGGIGKATINRKAGQWPGQVSLLLKLGGLESLEVSCGDVAVSAAVSSHGDYAVSQHLLKDGKEGPPLTKDSPYWMIVRTLDASGKPAKGLPDKDGCFEVAVPKALLDEKPGTMKLSWIDFYR